jgi:hypothetical protein
MSAPRVAPLMGVTAYALRTSVHLHQTPTPGPRANPRRLIDWLAPHRAERPGNEPGSMTACPWHCNLGGVRMARAGSDLLPARIRSTGSMIGVFDQPADVPLVPSYTQATAYTGTSNGGGPRTRF